MTAGVPDEVSKGEFAVLRNVTPGRVSQWLSEGKIGPEALVGEGRNARIKVGIATEQLRQRLDLGQRFGNGLGTNLALPPTSARAEPETPRPSPTRPASDVVEERIKQAKLTEIEHRNRRLAEEEAERRGRYIETADARREMMRIASDMLKLFEGSLTELASAAAAKFQVPQRDMLHLLRAEFCTVRAKAAEALKRQANDLPEFIDDEVEVAAETKAA